MIRRHRNLVLTIAAGILLIPLPAAAQDVPTTDLAITSSTLNVKHGHVGQRVTFTILAVNHGPDIAPSLDVTATFQGLELVEEACDLGISADTPSCEYHDIVPGQTLTTRVVAEIVSTGAKTATGTACVSSEVPITDPSSGNDCKSAGLKVIGKR